MTGYESPNDKLFQTFIDYDAITGYAYRYGLRLQVLIRLEANVLYPNAFQSQQRCVPPTKFFSAGSGYGCFTYIPLLWYEDAAVMNYDDYSKLKRQFYSRPGELSLIVV